MSDPICRACYAATLTSGELERFNATLPTTCVYFCAEHQSRLDDLMAQVPLVPIQVIQAALGRDQAGSGRAR